MPSTPTRPPWLAMRRELPAARSGWLMAFSFALPLLLWCVFSYVPWFHSDLRLTVTAERQAANTATLTVGDRVDKGYFAGFVAEVEAVNAATRQRIAAGDLDGSTRENTKILRTLQPLAAEAGALEGVDIGDRKAVDAALFGVWLDAADGSAPAVAEALDEENLGIVRENAALMRPFAPHDPENKVGVPLLNLLPQGVSAPPVFLPAPDECLAAFVEDFTTEPPNDGPWMHERLLSSLKVVFGGFGMACLVGLPLGILCGSFALFSRVFEPFTDFFRYMPAPTFSLLLVAAFGVEGAPKLALVFIGTFPAPPADDREHDADARREFARGGADAGGEEGHADEPRGRARHPARSLQRPAGAAGLGLDVAGDRRTHRHQDRAHRLHRHPGRPPQL